MAEFKISRLRYTWRQGWQTSRDYNKDDVVEYAGNSYICVRQHTSGAFANDQTYLANPGDSAPTPAWLKMTDGRKWTGEWTSDTPIGAGELILYGGVVYICIENHQSGTTFLENANKFAVYVSLYDWTSDWQPTTRYGVGDLVRYGGNIYIAIAEHTSGTTEQGIEIGNNDSLEDSSGELWEVFNEGIRYTGEWAQGTRYRLNDLVKYGGSILRVFTGHTAGVSIDSAFCNVEFPGNRFAGMWMSTSYYAVGDVVRHGGKIYRANTNNTNVNPATSLYDQPSPRTEWSLIVNGINLAGEWAPDTTYKTGDVVYRGGYLYVAKVDTITASDGSTLDYLDTSNWEIFLPGDDYAASWTQGVMYALGDLVLFKGGLWRCTTQHIASDQNFPGDNGSGYEYWEVLIQAGDGVGLSSPGDLLTYNLSRTLAGDGSTLGETSIPIGNQDELLKIQADEQIGYETFGGTPKFIFVATNGIDDNDPRRGIDEFKPFKTIKYATEYVRDQAEPNLYRIKVATGEYKEILPIVIPAGVAITGDELRSTTVKPNEADASLSGDRTYNTEALNHLATIIDPILNLTNITPSAGNEQTQVTTFEGDALGGLGTPVASDKISYIADLIDDAKQYIDFYLASDGTDPTVTGTNVDNYNADLNVDAQEYMNIKTILEANREFIAEEIARYLVEQYEDYTGNTVDVKRRIRGYVNAFIYDTRYTSNYRTLLEARYYKNEVNGSKLDDMFYCRDATGVRDMSTKGLSGTLNPPEAYELYRRPTGGAFVSLDPGWGPDHEEVWITTRSPYIQNVTTFGDNCVGQKIDGALHNGGNKSIVSNDFTQVISDGIGAWVLNNGRAELVSVFTYYAQIGMFAERGGIIRATNGNSSYGDFGTLADGNDPTETPAYAEVNNRVGQATVEAAFSGEVSDEILILEYRNAGGNYSYADYTFTGAGVDASAMHEETRDDALSEALIKNPPGDAGATEGGLGYFLDGNNLQSGTTTTATLATADDNDEEDLLGLRIILTSGQGAGQYGYVTAYNPATKVLNVSKESDDTPGWDHIIPGTPIKEILLTDNTYRFEPRVTFSHPGYTSGILNLQTSANYSAVVYGETREIYNSIQGQAGTGDVAEDVTPAAAEFTVEKVGREYTVTIQNGGAGYEAGQILTLTGSSMGGVDGENDITVNVLETSEDSTNQITAIRASGIATSGRYVAVTSDSSHVAYSEDANNWLSTTLPDAGNWVSLAAGGTYFVAIRKDSDRAAYSRDGLNWIDVAMPGNSSWESVTYGKSTTGAGVFLAVSSTGDEGAYSTDGGATWSATTLPDIGDSTVNNWVDVAYGQGRFIALANSGNNTAHGEYNSVTNTWSWQGQLMDVIADSSQRDWSSIAYGNNRFIAVSTQGDVSISLDRGDSWITGTALPTQDGSTAHYWKQIRYGQGVFIAIGDTGGRDIFADATGGPSTFATSTEDGVLWTERAMPEALNWTAVGFGNPDISIGDSTTQSNSTGIWVAVATSQNGAKIETGCRAKGRAWVESGSIKHIRLWDVGSGYAGGIPTITITDPNNTADAYIEMRMDDRVLGQPGWRNRGSGYRTSSTTVTVVGDGYADEIPEGKFVYVSGLATIPGPGSQFRFRGEEDFYTVQAGTLESTQIDGTLTGRFRMTPEFDLNYFLEHTSQVEIRERYSQVRITGHDFLDVGTGNFVETNYPTLYSSGNFFNSAPENEIVELNGGRVFYTATDQNGNFRCGELFAVEQATGIVTISADFFDLQGLTELALGGVRLGGSGAVVREFSTDPLFTQDSNNVVPTQRAIKSYLQNRLNVGGADLLTANFVAGVIKVGPSEISNVAGTKISFPVRVDFVGDQAGASGHWIAESLFYKGMKG